MDLKEPSVTEHPFFPHGLAHKALMSRPRVPWKTTGSEPSLESLLVAPVLLTMLARNGVTVEELRELSQSVGERLRHRHFSPTT